MFRRITVGSFLDTTADRGSAAGGSLPALPTYAHAGTRFGAGGLEQGFASAAMTSIDLPAFEFRRIRGSAIFRMRRNHRKPRL